MSQSPYKSKHDLEAREVQWLGGKQRVGTKHGAYPTYGSNAAPSELNKTFVGNTSLPSIDSNRLSDSAAIEMEQVRLRMREQRDLTEAMIEQLMISHEQARKERESLVLELASMSTDSSRKLLVKIIKYKHVN